MRVVFLIWVFCGYSLTNFAHAKSEEWRWIRVESGHKNSIVMRGSAVVISSNSRTKKLLLKNDDQSIDSFEITVKNLGKDSVQLSFKPPNSEAYPIRINGRASKNRVGGHLYEQLGGFDHRTGNFLLLNSIPK
jgi:hypothetical protein